MGSLVLLGRDLGWEGSLLKGRGAAVLDDCLLEAGIRKDSVEVLHVAETSPPGNRFEALGRSIDVHVSLLRGKLQDLRPSLVVAFGNEAAQAVLPEWDGGIEEKRGYFWDSPFGFSVLTTVSPDFALKSWKPFRTLLSFDLQRAKEVTQVGHLRRPRREVEIVSGSRDARNAVEAVRRYRRASVDIETYDADTLACVGFAGESGKAFVFPARHLSDARPLLENPRLRKIFANGIFDAHFLKYRAGVQVEGFTDDVQLAWWSLYPELAGKEETKRRHKITRKSLAFLASLFTLDAWWKGEYETEEEFFIYNGRDCCITFDIMERLDKDLDAMGVRSVYSHVMSLVEPCVEMLERGLRVDEVLRKGRLKALQERSETLRQELNELVLPLLEEAKEAGVDLRLFEQVEGVCPCCRHASKKQEACWSCAGFDSSPSKADLVARGGDPSKLKRELEEEFLGVCKVCGGVPRREWLEFNPNSGPQTQTILYDFLKLPKRMKDGRLTTDESALKSLVAFVA